MDGGAPSQRLAVKAQEPRMAGEMPQVAQMLVAH